MWHFATKCTPVKFVKPWLSGVERSGDARGDCLIGCPPPTKLSYRAVPYGGHCYWICALCNVTFWCHINISKSTFWRSLLSQSVYYSTRSLILQGCKKACVCYYVAVTSTTTGGTEQIRACVSRFPPELPIIDEARNDAQIASTGVRQY